MSVGLLLLFLAIILAIIANVVHEHFGRLLAVALVCLAVAVLLGVPPLALN